MRNLHYTGLFVAFVLRWIDRPFLQAQSTMSSDLMAYELVFNKSYSISYHGASVVV